jgi:penicillin-binding protein 2
MTELRTVSSEPYARSFLAMSFIAAALFGVLILRLVHIQLWEGETYRNLSENNRIRLIEIHAPRGKIMDVRRENLADNRPSFHVTAIPEEVQDYDALEKTLSAISPLPPEALHGRFQEMKKATPFLSYLLWKDASWETVAYIEANRIRIPGVFIQVNQSRDYLFGDLLGSVIGYMGEISEQQLKEDPGDRYRMGDWIGKVGVEKMIEEHLRGKKGGQQVEVDALGRQIRILQETDPVPGVNAVLTLDRRLQSAAWDALEEKTGTAIAVDPRDGSVLCYVNRPSFDPNHFIRGIPREEWKALSDDPRHPLTNRGIQGQYPPGSVFKILMAVAGLEEGVINPEEKIFCPGSYQLGAWTFRCWKRHGHGSVDLHRALVESCDVYFYQVGQRLGIQRIQEYAERFGLGSPTGLGIAAEKPGLVPSPEWKRRRYKMPWYEGETLMVSIGQGALLTTPLQMLMMVSAVANGGTLWTPRLVHHLEYADGRLYMPVPPERRASVSLALRTRTLVREALRDVVQGPGGTGRSARLPNIEVAGKTGTAQVVHQGESKVPESQISWEKRDHAWFVCYAPVQAPEIAVVVMVEHGGHGGSAAAPVAKKILEAYFLGKGEPPPL